MEYRQNSIEPYTGDDGDTEDIPDEESHGGNTGLPFGLCKKYGISLPQNATPRDAWNALAGKGIYPPWTEKGKDQYKDENGKEQKPTEPDNKIALTEHKKKVYDTIHSKMSKFPEDYRNKLYSAISNLTDDELEVFAKTIDKVEYKQGSGLFHRFFNTITVPTGNGDPLDRELGYNFPAVTYFHEYGHYLASLVGENEGLTDFNYSTEIQDILADDFVTLMQRAMDEDNNVTRLNVNRLSREQKESFYKLLHKLSDKDIARTYKPVEPEFNEDYYNLGKLTRMYESWGYGKTDAYNRAVAYIEEGKEQYRQKLEQYKKDIVKYNEVKDKIPAAQANYKRAGFLSDFIAGATGGRINPYNASYWGHTDSYWKGSNSGYIRRDGMGNGVETWAEYVSYKMTKDNKGLSMIKEYLPKTYKKYEEIYSTLKEKLK